MGNAALVMQDQHTSHNQVPFDFIHSVSKHLRNYSVRTLLTAFKANELDLKPQRLQKYIRTT